MDNNNPFVSIIIPTYNVEKYLLKCLESISAQTYHHYEVIIIIDGATDGSYLISQDYCSSHDNFYVYYQENAGSGPARNNGIAHAKGELIMFVDPDDWLDTKLLEELVNAQKQGDYDITTSMYRRFYDDNSNISEIKPRKFCHLKMNNQSEMIKYHKQVLMSGYCSAPWRILYKTSIIKENAIEFPALRRSQDVVFNCRYYQYAQSFQSIEYRGYCYRMTKKEGLAKNRSNYHESIKVLYEEFNNLYTNWGVEFDKTFFSTLLFEKYFFGSLSMCIRQNIDIIPMIEDKGILEIVNNTSCSSIIKRVAVWSIEHKKYVVTKSLLRFYNIIKEIQSSIFFLK